MAQKIVYKFKKAKGISKVAVMRADALDSSTTMSIKQLEKRCLERKIIMA